MIGVQILRVYCIRWPCTATERSRATWPLLCLHVSIFTPFQFLWPKCAPAHCAGAWAARPGVSRLNRRRTAFNQLSWQGLVRSAGAGLFPSTSLPVSCRVMFLRCRFTSSFHCLIAEEKVYLYRRSALSEDLDQCRLEALRTSPLASLSVFIVLLESEALRQHTSSPL